MNSPEGKPSSYWFSFGCLLAVVTLVAASLGGCLALIRWSDGEFEIATIDCGTCREIVITAARSWEISQPIFYFVRVDGDVVVPTTYFNDSDPHNNPQATRFTHFTAEGGNLVGVTYADKTSKYLIVHDFASGHSFSSGDHIEWNGNLAVDENRELHNGSRANMEARLDTARSGNPTGA